MKANKSRDTFCMVNPDYDPSGRTFRDLTLPDGRRVRMLNRALFESGLRAANKRLRELLREDRAARTK